MSFRVKSRSPFEQFSPLATLGRNDKLRMKKIFFILFLVISPLFLISEAHAAASLSLSPTSQSVARDQTFNVNLTLNTGGASTTGCDVILTFNPQILKVESVSFGANPLFSTTNRQTIDNTNGKLTLNSDVVSAAFAYSGTGTLATITFKGLATGSSAVSFNCTGGTDNHADTNVWDTQSQDIVNCSANIGGTYTITSGATEPAATPTPDSDSDQAEATPTPPPPAAGNISLTVSSFIFGIFFFLSGILLRLVFLRT